MALLKTIFYCLNYSGDLIFAALNFIKTNLELAEKIAGFGNLVETISKNAFQKFDKT